MTGGMAEGFGCAPGFLYNWKKKKRPGWKKEGKLM